MILNPLISIFELDGYYNFYNTFDKDKEILIRTKKIIPEYIDKHVFQNHRIHLFIPEQNYMFYQLIYEYVEDSNKFVNKKILSNYLLKNLSKTKITIVDESDSGVYVENYVQDFFDFEMFININSFNTDNSTQFVPLHKGILLNLEMDQNNNSLYQIGPFLELEKDKECNLKNISSLNVVKAFDKGEIQFFNNDFETQIWNIIVGAIIDYFSDYITMNSIGFDRIIIVNTDKVYLSEKFYELM